MRSFIYNIGIYIVAFAIFFVAPTSSVSAQDAIKFRTICIDAGHGGKDPGCVSKDQKTYEKDIALSVATLFGDKIKENCPDVKVVYTRSKDVYLTLDERAAVANRNKANLFVSIHVNAVDATSANGFSSHILGQSSKKGRDTFAGNLNVCKRENSVIMMEDDYSTKYAGFDPSDPESSILFTLMQNAFYEQSMNIAQLVNEQMDKAGAITVNRGISQDPFYVLWKTTMPAMLFEMGFISNKGDLDVITTEEGREKIAEALFQAFLKFKDEYNKSLNYNKETTSDTNTSTTSNEVEVKENKTRYGVQVSTSTRLLGATDPFFKKNRATIYPAGKVYKYVLGESENVDEVENFYHKISKDFPDCFMVKIEGETVKYYKK